MKGNIPYKTCGIVSLAILAGNFSWFYRLQINSLCGRYRLPADCRFPPANASGEVDEKITARKLHARVLNAFHKPEDALQNARGLTAKEFA